MQIRVLGAHNCESRDSRYACFVIDGVLAIDSGALTSGLTFEEQSSLKAILVTHLHYDHVKDIPSLALTRFFQGHTIRVLATEQSNQVISGQLLDGNLYPRFTEIPRRAPSVSLETVTPCQPFEVNGYHVLAVPVSHTEGSVGYEVTSADGRRVFFTGDTGVGLHEEWGALCPDLLVSEVTLPNREHDFAMETRHLTACMLHQELTLFRDLKGYLPRVLVVHMNPHQEVEIAGEVATVATDLGADITLAREGQVVTV